MNTPAPSPTKPTSHSASGKRVCDHRLKLDALNKKLRSAGTGVAHSRIAPTSYHECTPRERRELEEQMRKRDEEVQKAEAEAKAIRDAEGRAQVRADVMVPQGSSSGSVWDSKLEAMERQLRRMAKKGDRSMRRIQKEMEIMAIKQREVAKNLDKLAGDMMTLESKMESLEVEKGEDMEIEKD